MLLLLLFVLKLFLLLLLLLVLLLSARELVLLMLLLFLLLIERVPVLRLARNEDTQYHLRYAVAWEVYEGGAQRFYVH
jgi:hypothetical protein